jgi:IS30 family transposase
LHRRRSFLAPRDRKSGKAITAAELEEILQRRSRGQGYRQIAVELNCSETTIYRVLARPRKAEKKPKVRSPLRLSFAEREEISRGVQVGLSFRTLARQLGRAPSTISREVKRGGRTNKYRAWRAEKRTGVRARRPKKTKFEANPRLKAEVESRLRQCWSPQQISARLNKDYPDDPSMQISHETIYQSLFIQTRGALRKELTAHLRTKRTRRKPRSRVKKRGNISEMVMISNRPAEVEDRAVPGHWEGDLIIGAKGRSAIATLVERRSRFVMLIALPDGRGTESVCGRLADHFQTLPNQLRRSLTWDQGNELANHRSLHVATDMKIYFCDPGAPWQRGSNENTNGLLRQYFPKSTDLASHSQAHLDEVAQQLNCRPRQTLDWMKPCEIFSAVASTT